MAFQDFRKAAPGFLITSPDVDEDSANAYATR